MRSLRVRPFLIHFFDCRVCKILRIKCYVVESVEIYIPNERPMRLGVDDTIEGGDILPEFELAVKDIFK